MWATRLLLPIVGGAAGLILGFIGFGYLLAPAGPCPAPCDGAAYNALGGAVCIGLPVGAFIGSRVARGVSRRLTT